MNLTIPLIAKRGLILFTLLLLTTSEYLYSQGTSYKYFYRVYFKDKGTNNPGNYTFENLISARAINRRHKTGVFVPAFNDIPVYNEYITTLTTTGLKLHCTSKWQNTALFKSDTPVSLSAISSLPFVKEVKTVKASGIKTEFPNKLGFDINISDTQPYDRPVSMLNGKSLHIAGFNGKDVLIAVLDGGFQYCDIINSLENLRSRNGIKATRDFINNTQNVYSSSTHGTAVMSVLAGKIPDFIEGTAQGADYLLLKTEDVTSEFPAEEDYWAAGAEYADSCGADIITSSLGYYNFDDPAMNYKYSDLDGKTSFITRAAEIAAGNGIIVVNSAGNERVNQWKKVIFPADGEDVIAVGAVDGNNSIASFSSTGFSADNRIKPDVVTMGVSVPVQTAPDTFGKSNGTSFSCPVLSGMIACLLQAVPQSVNSDIISAVRSSSDRYNKPDSLFGFGIPDLIKTLKKLQDLYVKIPDNGTLISPNPTKGKFEIIFREPPIDFTVDIISGKGNLIFRQSFKNYPGRKLPINELLMREQGTYYVRISGDSGIFTNKIIKLAD
jgi:serine protease AprX